MSDKESRITDYRSLLMRALAYLPVPASFTGHGTPVGVITPDPNEITSVERLRREIQAALRTPSENTPAACAEILAVLEETYATAMVSSPPKRMFQNLDERGVKRIYEIAKKGAGK